MSNFRRSNEYLDSVAESGNKTKDQVMQEFRAHLQWFPTLGNQAAESKHLKRQISEYRKIAAEEGQKAKAAESSRATIENEIAFIVQNFEKVLFDSVDQKYGIKRQEGTVPTLRLWPQEMRSLTNHMDGVRLKFFTLVPLLMASSNMAIADRSVIDSLKSVLKDIIKKMQGKPAVVKDLEKALSYLDNIVIDEK